MKPFKNSFARPALHTGPWLALAAVLFLSVPSTAGAVEHQVFGQVLQVSAADAADESIADAALTGSPRPFAHVRVFDADTLELLGEVDSDVSGLFSVTFDKPLAYSPRIDCRVLQVMRDPTTLAIESTVLPPARDDINTFASVPRYFLTFLKVTADDSLDYGDMSATAGVSGGSGFGLFFTRVGKTETQFIRQNTTATGGLADFTSNPSRAAALGVPAFRDAPFGGQLSIFGEFGGCGPAGAPIDYYRVKMRRVDPAPVSAWLYWNQPLQKTRTLIATSPTLSVVSEIVPVGPFTGTASGSTLPNLYWVNRNEVGGATSTIYSFPDKRVEWSTGGWPDGNGLYELAVEYYTHDSGDVDNPAVHPVAPGCIHTPAAPMGQLFLRVNNQPVQVVLEGIFLKSAAGYFAGVSGGADTTVPSTAGAHNFATTGQCDIMELKGQYDVEVHFTARHPSGYMLSYALQAKPNAGPTVTFDSKRYPQANEAPTFPPGAAPPLWHGAAPDTIAIAMRSEFVRCGYIFELGGTSRLQNGDQYIDSAEIEKAWYVMPMP